MKHFILFHRAETTQWKCFEIICFLRRQWTLIIKSFNLQSIHWKIGSWKAQIITFKIWCQNNIYFFNYSLFRFLKWRIIVTFKNVSCAVILHKIWKYVFTRKILHITMEDGRNGKSLRMYKQKKYIFIIMLGVF